MSGYDLICTYNWGAMDAVMAHTVFADAFKLPPLVHHEDGFNEDEANGLKRRRNWYRRIALGRTAALVVPSERREDIALNIWQQPRSRVRRIPNGIDTRAYAAPPKRDILPRLVKHKTEMWVGSLAGLRKVKQLDMLVRCKGQGRSDILDGTRAGKQSTLDCQLRRRHQIGRCDDRRGGRPFRTE